MRTIARPASVGSGLGLLLVAIVTVGPAAAVESRTDHRPSGNRVADGRGPLTEVVDLPLAAAPLWIIPSPAEPAAAWIVADADGTIRLVSEGGGVRPMGALPAGAPPLATRGPDGEISVADARAATPAALPDAREVRLADGTTVLLTEPTDRYAHGVLGDGLEAGALSVTDPSGAVSVIVIEGDAVIEGLAPIAADLDGDGTEEIIVTISDPAVGARLVAYAADGAVVAESDPIGRGFRWRHQLAAGPFGPEGEVELVGVRTPHIGGIVETFRLVGDRLELVATVGGFSSHRIGSPNLDMGLLADVSGDGGPLELVVPTDAMTELGVLGRTPDGFALVALLPLEGVLVTNVAAASDADGRLVLAAGTDDGRLRIFR